MAGSPMPKHCPRCRGFMIREEDAWGPFGCCASCGYHHEFHRITSEEILEEAQRDEGRQRKGRHPSHGSGARRVSL